MDSEWNAISWVLSAQVLSQVSGAYIRGSEKLSTSNLSFNTKISIKIKHLSRVLEENNTNRPNCTTITSYEKKVPQKRPSQELHNLSDCDYIMEKFSLLIQHTKEK